MAAVVLTPMMLFAGIMGFGLLGIGFAALTLRERDLADFRDVAVMWVVGVGPFVLMLPPIWFV